MVRATFNAAARIDNPDNIAFSHTHLRPQVAELVISETIQRLFCRQFALAPITRCLTVSSPGILRCIVYPKYQRR